MTTEQQTAELLDKAIEVQGHLLKIVQQLSDKVEKLQNSVDNIVEANQLKTFNKEFTYGKWVP